MVLNIPRDEVVAVQNPTAIDAEAKSELMTRCLSDNYEWVVAYGVLVRNDILLCTQESSTMCGISPTIEALLKHTPCVVHHNHPSNKPFSQDDFSVFIDSYPHLKAFHAHGHDGLSSYDFIPNSSLSHVGEIAYHTAMLSENLRNAMGWPVGDPVHDLATRHGLGLGFDNRVPRCYRHNIADTRYQRRILHLDIRCVEDWAVRLISLFYDMLNFCQINALTLSVLDLRGVVDALISCTQFNMPIFMYSRPTQNPHQIVFDHFQNLQSKNDWLCV